MGERRAPARLDLAWDVFRIVAVTVGLTDLSVTVVNLQFRPLTLAHATRSVDGFLLGVVVRTCTARTPAFVVPTAVGVRHDVPSVAS